MPTYEIYATREAWLAARRQGIGGSDAPCIMGLDKERGAADVWLEKVDGKAEEAPIERMKWGRRMESTIREGYAEDSGREILPIASTYTIHRRHDARWCAYSPDGLQRSADFDGVGVVQIKSVDFFQREKWLDGPPEKYTVQLQHEMMVEGVSWGTLVALFGGNECAWWDVQANPVFQEALFAEEREFWRCVEEQRCPPVDAFLPTALKALKRLYPESQRSTISLMGDRWIKQLNDLQEISLSMKELEREADQIKAAFQAEMRLSECAILEDGRQVTWRTSDVKGYTVEPRRQRVFRFPRGWWKSRNSYCTRKGE